MTESNQRYRRGEILRAVLEAADQRRDGTLPTDLPGVNECFRDELDLLAVLSLRWHTRLSARLDAELASQPTDRTDAVVRAWSRTARDSEGLRAILDTARATSPDANVVNLLTAAEHREWERLAHAAGYDGVDAGRQLAERARLAVRETRVTVPAQRTATRTTHSTHPVQPTRTATRTAARTPSLVARIRSVLAA